MKYRARERERDHGRDGEFETFDHTVREGRGGVRAQSGAIAGRNSSIEVGVTQVECLVSWRLLCLPPSS